MTRLIPISALLLFPVSALAQDGGAAELRVELAYTGETLAGAGGGHADYVDNLDIIAEVETGETRAKAYILYNNGHDFSGPRFPRGYVASNIETGVRAVRLYEAWIEQGFADGKASLLAGLFDYNSEFDALDASALFTNPVHGIGNDIGQTGSNGPSIFPVTSLAVRLSVQPTDALTIRAAVFDGVPGDPARPRRTAVRFDASDGVMLALEADQRIDDWRFLLGGWRYSARFDDVLATAIAGGGVTRRGNHGLYLRGEGRLAGAEAGEGRGVDAFFRLGWAAGRFNPVERLATAGVRWRAPFIGRADDEAGIALAWSGASGRLRRAGALTGERMARNEWAAEASYKLQITGWLGLRPSVQFIANPAFEPNRDAWVGALRFAVTWSNQR